MRIKTWILYLIGAMVSMFQFILLLNFMDNFSGYLEKRKKALNDQLLDLKCQSKIEDYKQKLLKMSQYILGVEAKVAEMEDLQKKHKQHEEKYRIMVKILAYSYIHSASLEKSLAHFTSDIYKGERLFDDDTREFMSRFIDKLNECEIFLYQPASNFKPWIAKDGTEVFTELRLRRKA